MRGRETDHAYTHSHTVGPLTECFCFFKSYQVTSQSFWIKIPDVNIEHFPSLVKSEGGKM